MFILFLCLFVFQITAQELEGQFNAESSNGRWKYTGSYRVNVDLNGSWKIEAQTIEIDLKHNKNRTLFYRDGAALSVDHRKTKCLSGNEVPPIEHLQQSFENMYNVEMDFVYPSIASLCDGSLKEIRFYGLSYLVCIDSSGRLKSGFGKDFTVYFSPGQSKFQIPNILDDCPKAIIINRKVKTQAIKENQWWHQKQIQNKNKITPKTCLFVHGSGQVGFQPATSTFTDYWGDVHLYTSQCSKHSFIHVDTLNYGWDTELLQTSFCNFATADQDNKYLIQNKIIFSHSMGNLIIAGAIFNNTCRFDTTSTSWYSANKPANGSKVATDLLTICNSTGVEYDVAKLVGACTPYGQPSIAYHTLLPYYPKLNIIYPILQSYIKGAMCGTSPGGLNSIYSFPLELVAEIANLETPNDGLVWFDSCNIGMYGNDTDPTSLFYVAEINHADGTCRNGNGFWGGTRQPCDWYSGKV